MTELTSSERSQIAEILGRRANEIASYNDEHRRELPSSVEYALSREIQRLRKLADKVSQPPTPPEDEGD